jgi:hypothetical protein
MGHSSVVVVVHPDGSMPDVKSELERRGLTQIQELPNLKMLKGTIPDSGVASLRDVAGVASVEQERTIQLPPKDSPVQ